jgi:PD-(D/E)XK nuclease superfamily
VDINTEGSMMRMIRNSERSTFLTCRHRWALTWVLGRQATSQPTALRFGDLVHQALAAYYIPGRKRGPAPAGTFAKLYEKQAQELHDNHGFNVFSDEAWVDALDLGRGMLTRYVEEYEPDDAEYDVISSEQVFQVLVHHDLSRAFRFKAVGTLDGVWRHRPTGRIIFKEFKTATAINVDALALDEQASMYWTFGPQWLRRKGILKEGEDIDHILYTFLRKALPNKDYRFDAEGHKLNKDGSISKVQPSPYFVRVPVYRDRADKRTFYNRLLAESVDMLINRAGMEEFMAAGMRELPPTVYKNPGTMFFPNCRGCPVRESCEVHESGGDWLSVLDQITVPYDGYAQHELPERR